jgi:hypothetical protein
MLVVSDTSPITNLLKINKLDLLKTIFEEVVVPDMVHDELLAWKNLGGDISDYENATWIKTATPNNAALINQLRVDLDAGEAEAIALAAELKANYLLIDERRGWKTAKSLGINAIGIVGVLLQAKYQGKITEVLPLIDELRTKAGFWLSEEFYQKVKVLVKE